MPLYHIWSSRFDALITCDSEIINEIVDCLKNKFPDIKYERVSLR